MNLLPKPKKWESGKIPVKFPAEPELIGHKRINAKKKCAKKQVKNQAGICAEPT